MLENASWSRVGSCCYEIEIHRDIRIPTQDSEITLSADVYLPVSPDPIPALVTAYPYRKDLMVAQLGTSLRWFAERGFACVHLDLRGIGDSDGMPDPRCGGGWGEDAVVAIEWAAAQPWCSGSVGMWGISAGGVTTLAAARLKPKPLKAIIPLMTTVDPERYCGIRGDFGLLAQWGGGMLVRQLLPPLRNFTSKSAQRRWQERLHHTEPFILDLARHGSDDPEWRRRVIDAAEISVPALCVGGWNDIYSATIPRIYENVRGPKKLLVGPWGHSFPQNSPSEPVDFHSIALRWWLHWLSGVDNGMMDEPPVALYVSGKTSDWRGFKSWPPPALEFILATRADTALTKGPLDSEFAGRLIGEYQPDPTIGASNSVGSENEVADLLVDSHDDDMRSLSCTSEPLQQDLQFCGCAYVKVRIAPKDGRPASMAERIVVRLTEVDAQGRSTLITTGVLKPYKYQEVYEICLAPATRYVVQGHRLRVTVSDSDFPRLTPLFAPRSIAVSGVELSLPCITSDAGEAICLPRHAREEYAPMSARADTAGGPQARWSITRDPIVDCVEVIVASSAPEIRTCDGHRLKSHSEARSKVIRSAPDGVVTTGRHSRIIEMRTGEIITVMSAIRCTQNTLWARGEVVIDDITVYSKIWETPLGGHVKSVE